jgi:2Fe-2S ferredoxin
MPTIVFERTGYTAEVPEGGSVVDVCDAHPRAGVPFSCRDANCGTCRIEVTEGIEWIEPPGPSEAELLDIFGNRPGIRLGCQMRVRAGAGVVRLRVTL